MAVSHLFRDISYFLKGFRVTTSGTKQRRTRHISFSMIEKREKERQATGSQRGTGAVQGVSASGPRGRSPLYAAPHSTRRSSGLK